MAFAHARYGFLLRNIPVDSAGKFSATMTADAFVVLAAALYLGLETKVSWPGPAFSIPATPVISVVGDALSSVAFRAVAISASFMAVSGNCSGREKSRQDRRGRPSLRRLLYCSNLLLELYCSNSVTCLVSGAPPLRRRFAAPITAITVSDVSASRGTKTRCVFERRSGGFSRKPSAGFWVRSFGRMPSIMSLSLNFRRTQRPSVRGRV